MANVQTALRNRSTHDVGITLMYEHLAVGFAGYDRDNTSFDRKKEIAGAVEKLKEIRRQAELQYTNRGVSGHA